tara:strand:- start:8077 stop:8991 length:915 start_codon:yes stop_codon:yes gene_type:complete
LRCIIIGFGVQGKKRKTFAKDDCVATVDPFNPDSDYKSIYDVDLNSFDSALCCTPDKPKFEILKYLLTNKKHCLVEKPLWTQKQKDIINLEKIANKNNVLLYTSYNHRFEPHFIEVKNILKKKLLGKIYHCRLFYGNGTAQLVKQSKWRDKGSGVLHDLGSHLLDTINYWFNIKKHDWKLLYSDRYENKSPDHVVIFSKMKKPRIQLEMTLLSWRNSFYCDIIGEKGSIHIESLCKWGPSKFIFRQRVLPSGKPKEKSKILIKDDPTWEQEYKFFKKNVKKIIKTDLSNDLFILDALNRLIRNR